MSSPTAINLGSPHPLLQPPLTEGMQAACGPEGITLFVVLDRPSATEIRRLRRDAVVQFGFLPLPPFGYAWLARINGVATFDCPYSPAANPPDKQKLPARTATERHLISIHGVDTRGIVIALRAVTISPGFSTIVENAHAAAVAQAPRYSKAAWDTTVAAFQRRYPLPDDGFKDATITELGGLSIS